MTPEQELHEARKFLEATLATQLGAPAANAIMVAIERYVAASIAAKSLT